MIEWIKTIFLNKPNTTTPLTARWFNDLQDWIQSIQNEVKSISVRLGLISDFIIEIGNSTNGSYEKWHSGKLVQRGKYSTGPQTLAVLVAPIYWKNNVPLANFPINFVGDLPNIQITYMRKNNAGWCNDVYSSRSLSSLGMTDLFGTNVNHAGMEYDWQAVGTWKT